MNIIVEYDDGKSKTWEDIAIFDFYTREQIEDFAERKLSDEEYSDIKSELEYLDDIDTDSVYFCVKNFFDDREEE